MVCPNCDMAIRREGFRLKASDLIERSFKTAEGRGWHDRPRSPSVIAVLFHSEVSEFVEEVRAGKPAFYESEDGAIFRGEFREEIVPKPSGQAVELVDLAIRIGDYAGTNGWELKFGTFKTSEECWADWATAPDNVYLATIENARLTDPLEFASILHKYIVRFDEAMSDGLSVRAEEILSGILKSIVLFFDYRDWNFDAMFDKKDSFNSKRPYRHGDKLA